MPWRIDFSRTGTLLVAFNRQATMLGMRWYGDLGSVKARYHRSGGVRPAADIDGVDEWRIGNGRVFRWVRMGYYEANWGEEVGEVVKGKRCGGFLSKKFKNK